MPESSPCRPLPPHPFLPAYYRDPADRQRWVTAAFDRNARHYRRIDWVVSLGTGGRYRRQALRRAGLRPGMRVLDVAVGSGPLARAARAVLQGSAGLVLGLDPSLGMLVASRDSSAGAGGPAIRLLGGIAEALPVADGSFDFLSMGYGLRHVADLRAAFGEYHRALRPGGRLVILEISRPGSGLGRALLRLYLRGLVPRLVRLATGSAQAGRLMRYYWETVDRCVAPEVIVEALAAAGFREVRRQAIGGVLSEFRARRSPAPSVRGVQFQG